MAMSMPSRPKQKMSYLFCLGLDHYFPWLAVYLKVHNLVFQQWRGFRLSTPILHAKCMTHIISVAFMSIISLFKISLLVTSFSFSMRCVILVDVFANLLRVQSSRINTLNTFNHQYQNYHYTNYQLLVVLSLLLLLYHDKLLDFSPLTSYTYHFIGLLGSIIMCLRLRDFEIWWNPRVFVHHIWRKKNPRIWLTSKANSHFNLPRTQLPKARDNIFLELRWEILWIRSFL